MARFYIQFASESGWITFDSFEGDRLFADEIAHVASITFPPEYATTRAISYAQLAAEEGRAAVAKAKRELAYERDLPLKDVHAEAHARLHAPLARVKEKADQHRLKEERAFAELGRSKAELDEEIRKARDVGLSLRDIGEAAGLTPQRIHQIVDVLGS